MNEQELIAGCKRRNPKYQQALYTLYAPRMMSVCIRYVNNREVAQDLLQDGFVKVFTKIDSYTGIGVFAGWVRRIFVTTALEYLRQSDLMRFSVSIDDCKNIEDEGDISILNQLSADDLLACIAKLPLGYRSVFNLYAIEGYSHKEIAEMLNIKENSSQSQLVRARRMLQENIKLVIGNEYAKQGIR